MKFEVEENFRGKSDDELLDELRRCAKEVGRDTIIILEFDDISKCHPSTLQRRFGSWPKSLELAGLQPSRSKIGITDDELFENIKGIWISLGRQPKYNEIKSPFSLYSAGTYEKRFGTLRKALRAFVDWVNSEEPKDSTGNISKDSPKAIVKKPSVKRRTNRNIQERQRFRILVRDGFHCQSCGASPIKERGVELHIDHILPWSKGGETVDDNLECKCSKCNLGKGNAFDV